ncbi:hypothetical protein [Longispora urticae]
MLAEHDPRHNLGAEVGTRLRQLNRIIQGIQRDMAVIQGPPVVQEAMMQKHLERHTRLTRGAITIEEYTEEILKDTDPEADAAFADATESVQLLTESFYLFAWRLVVVLTGNKPEFKFPMLEKFKDKSLGVLIVRNHLIEHPETQGQNFTQGTLISDDGPVLRTNTAIFGADGSVRSTGDTVDVGLYVNANQLRDELVGKFDRAAATLEAQRA